MKKLWKPLAIGLALLLVLAAGVVLAGLQLADAKRARQVPVDVKPVAYRTDPAALERGRYLFASRGCVDCHGANGGGRLFLDDGGLRIQGPNVTAAAGSAVANYQPVDWVRTIRHGVSPQGRALMVMPSEDYNRLTDEDLAALVAHIRSLPPTPGLPAVVDLPLPARVLYGFGAILDAAEKIDHRLPPAQPVAEGVNLAHGAYVANMCLGCHGAQLAGGKIPGAPPHWPAAANLTPAAGSGMAAYADADAFIRMIRSGKRADGSSIQVMPFESLRAMNDTDLRALHLYLKGLPARTPG